MKFYKETEFQETPIGKIPKDWELVKFSNIAEDIYYGITAKAVENETGLKMLRTTDIKNYSVDWDSLPFCEVTEKRGDIQRFLLKKGDLIIARAGTTGVSVLVEKDFENVIFGSYLIKVRLSRKVHPKFMHYFCQSHLYWDHITSGQAGSTIKNINLPILKSLNIPLPSLVEEQRAIAEILSTVDEAIQRTDEIIAKTEHLKKALMNELLTGRIRVREENGKLTFYTETDFQETEIGRIPKEWKIANLGSIAKVSSGNTAPQDEKYFENGKYPFIRVQHLTELQEQKYPVKYDLINEYAVLDLKLKKFKKGSIIFPKSGESIKLEKRAILKEDSYVVNHLAVIEPFHENIDNLFLFYYLCTVRTSNYLLKTTMPSLNLSTISNFLVPVPPIKEQQMIADILSTADSAIGLYYKEKYVLGRLRKGLMDMLLTGKVRVRED